LSWIFTIFVNIYYFFFEKSKIQMPAVHYCGPFIIFIPRYLANSIIYITFVSLSSNSAKV